MRETGRGYPSIDSLKEIYADLKKKVLQNAELILNSDGTTSFLPNKNIYLAAFIVAVILLGLLFFIFRMIEKAQKNATSK